MSNKDELKIRLMLDTENDIIKNMTEVQRYRYFLGRMQYLKYESGRENLFSADCSGSVCLALLLATNCSIRVTADELFRKYFTKKCFTENDIQAAFFITSETRKVGFKVYKKDQCAHVAGICGRDVVLNCVEPYSVLRSLSGMEKFYNENGYKIVLRGLDRKALQRASDSETDLFEADYQFLQLRQFSRL